MSGQPPTINEINVYDSLDERWAVEHFFGKDRAQALELFRENFSAYDEDLMFMGPKAFSFYVHAAIDYLVSRDSSDDPDAASSFCALIEFKLEYDSREIASVKPSIRNAISAILRDLARYGCDPGIYGDVATRYRHLLDGLVE